MNADRTPSPSADLLKWLGERRDGFLVGGAALYGLGYLVWSYNAWRNHLGQLPAIEFQYLMAGVVPAFLISLAWAGARFFASIQQKTIALFARYGFLRYASLIAISAFTILAAAVQYLTKKGWISTGISPKQINSYGAPLAIAISYLSLLTYGADRTSGHRADSRKQAALPRLYQYLVPAMFCWYCLVVYFDLYPNLPQELGGPQPRYAYVSLVQDDIAPSLLSALVPDRPTDAMPNSHRKVVRSSKLRVYFSSTDYMLVRTAANNAAAPGGNLKNEPLYELRKELIRAIEWSPD